ncbi:putative Histidine phosphatase superfamily (branch 1) [Blattamonas nauphoetae]|uniref:Histidine phosphatase superfamily (Branch 1) n=1 Tax=Blattamonas nauphoetae TaxID=2049346 RepID=A0ABQ9XF01_9EUKA|nr:putative Histidine phosphatase superfamily (branch 1) [Blattamonas nauphoetae]
MLLLYFIRHGETAQNSSRIVQGQSNVPLNERGTQQANQAGKSLMQVHFDHAFCSDLQRTRTTMEIIQSHNSHFPEVQYLPLLREIDAGSYVGKPYGQLAAEVRKRKGNLYTAKYPNGESRQDVYSRAKAFIAQYIQPLLASSQDIRRVCIVSHGGWITQCMRVLSTDLKGGTYPNFKTAASSLGESAAWTELERGFVLPIVGGTVPQLTQHVGNCRLHLFALYPVVSKKSEQSFVSLEIASDIQFVT